MIEIDHTLLSKDALDNLIIEIITRQATDYGEYELDIQTKKNQLMKKLQNGDAVIVYSSREEICDIIRVEEFNMWQSKLDRVDI
ncbi:YheU family protein [Legionella maioricensis]|uniref:YheU family protein n=1 Tax=Legionella maioricensis TaxID=2896528 RepID=A0A9X2D264_9GAMM|nr:YheU family protein [Legionella maioricensis]MCL9685063.1 YheU family protein [Legionella maioricensis]MCL9688176.1 YheU family protein [Legionella maioricensis]